MDILPEDAMGFVLEMIGYSLYADNPLQKAVLLSGPGGNGKSKLLKLLWALAGSENCVAIPLQAFGENRFAGADLYGKLANICGDLDARAIKRTDLFKQLTGGNVVRAERKYGHGFYFTSYALPIFSANEAPLTSDQTDAWFQRWLVVPMERVIRGTPMEDPNIEQKILRHDELEGLLVRAVVALTTLLERGHFDVPPSIGTRTPPTVSDSTVFAALSLTTACCREARGYRAPRSTATSAAGAPTTAARPRTRRCSTNGSSGTSLRYALPVAKVPAASVASVFSPRKGHRDARDDENVDQKTAGSRGPRGKMLPVLPPKRSDQDFRSEGSWGSSFFLPHPHTRAHRTNR